MPKKQKINILWFTKNLRTRDSETLSNIMREDLPFLALYVFDTDFFNQMQYGCRKIGKYRARFLLESVEDLKENLAGQNISLLVKQCKTQDVFKNIAEEFEIVKIFCQEEWTQEEISLQTKIKEVLPSVTWEKFYQQFLVHPFFVFKNSGEIPMLFTTFRQNIEKNLLIRPEFESAVMRYHNKTEIYFKSDEVTLRSLGFDDFETDKRSAFPFSGGEREALKRLDFYFSETKNLSRYKETRNGLTGTEYSSKFSAWLADGSLSAVTVYHEIKRYEEKFGSNESTYWLIFELLWRDFFRYTSLQHRDLIFRKNGIAHQPYSADPDDELIRQWKEGKTASDFVNAHMLELRHTGWMSNRGRQNVASYFCKILKQDWRIGASYFEEWLIDYDVHSNYGNWMYLGGVGNDNRDRTFNPKKQAEIYDPKHKFRTLWLK